jgi:hypothetical protein
MRSRRLELVILRFDDVTTESARSFVGRTDGKGHVHVIMAVVARHETDGSVTLEEWTQAADLSDLIADMAAHQQFDLSRGHIAYIARTVAPGATVLLLLLEHRCASDFATDLDSLGGVLLSSAEVPDERIRQAEGDFGR